MLKAFCIVLPCSIVVVAAAEKKGVWKPSEFVGAKIKAGVSAEDRKIVEELDGRRAGIHKRNVNEAASIVVELPKIRRGKIRPGARAQGQAQANQLRMAPMSINMTIKPDAKGDYYFTSKAEKEAFIRQEESRLKGCRNTADNFATNPLSVIQTFHRKPEVGEIGKLETSVKILQVASKTEVLADTGAVMGLVWIEEIDASKIVDGESMRLQWPFYISGTKSYVNALGAKGTALLAKPFGLEDFIEPVDP